MSSDDELRERVSILWDKHQARDSITISNKLFWVLVVIATLGGGKELMGQFLEVLK
jgi:hypothetical protein